MNRRVRKKKHLGEFDWKGFEVKCTYDVKLDLAGAGAFMDATIALAEANDLTVNGSSYGADGADFIVMRLRRGGKRRRGYTHCTREDRDIIGEHLQAQPFMGDFVIGALKGVWHEI